VQSVPGTSGGRDSTTPKALKGGEGELKPRRFRDLVVFGVALVVLAADQLSKHWVRGALVPGVPFNPVRWLRPVLSLTYVTNTGAAFGLFPQLGWLYALIAIAVIAFIVISYRLLPAPNWLIQVSLGMQLGGAIGNLVDRLWHGRVIDFIDLNFWPLQEWPVFNLADSSVVVGVCILAYYLLLDSSVTTVEDDECA